MARLVDGTAGHPVCRERFRHGAVAILGEVAEEVTDLVSLNLFAGPVTAEIFAAGVVLRCGFDGGGVLCGGEGTVAAAVVAATRERVRVLIVLILSAVAWQVSRGS